MRSGRLCWRTRACAANCTRSTIRGFTQAAVRAGRRARHCARCGHAAANRCAAIPWDWILPRLRKPAVLPPSGFLPYRFVPTQQPGRGRLGLFRQPGPDATPFSRVSVATPDPIRRFPVPLPRRRWKRWRNGLRKNPGLGRPAVFIFHMSRCGSTLVSQMLASVPRNLVVFGSAPDSTPQCGWLRRAMTRR